jgi:metallo-beta-lactamase family protein
VTHCHIDHVGRIPYLLAAGFKQPIYATTATASLLPLVIEDALKVAVTHDQKLIRACLNQLSKLIVPIDYNQWISLPINLSSNATLPVNQINLKFKPAGHILGSAYVELDLKGPGHKHRVVFSGDLGATYATLLASLKSPYRADTLVIESIYCDKNHQGRQDRS